VVKSIIVCSDSVVIFVI